MPFWQPVNVCLKWNESSSCLRKGSAFTWHIYSPYTSNVTNRELLLLGTDPQPKLGSATFSSAYLHQRGNQWLTWTNRGCLSTVHLFSGFWMTCYGRDTSSLLRSWLSLCRCDRIERSPCSGARCFFWVCCIEAVARTAHWISHKLHVTDSVRNW